VYRPVAAPRGPPHPPPITQGDGTGGVGAVRAVLPPCPGFRPPFFSPSGRRGSPAAAPIAAIRARRGPIGPGMRAPTSQRRRGGAQGAPPPPHPPCSPRSGGWAASGRPARGTTATRTRHARPPAPPPPRRAAPQPPPPPP